MSSEPAPHITAEETRSKLVCAECGKPLLLGQAREGFGDLLFRTNRCTCMEKDLDMHSAGKESYSGTSIVEAPQTNEPPEADELNRVREELKEHYDVIAVLGRGGMGAVYKVRHKELDKFFAVKMLDQSIVQNQSALRRFHQEAQAAQRLTHANLVSIYEYGTGKSGSPYIVMDYLDGKDLSMLLNENGPLRYDRAVPIFLQIAEALAHAHEKGVMHRDIKPDNVIVRSTNEVDLVKIVDFGIAKVLPDSKRPTQRLTQTGEVIGSPLYMSPEQCLGNEHDARSDIYALGCVMYETLTGSPPFEGDNTIKTILKHLNEEVIPLAVKAPLARMPQDMSAIVMHCLEKQPSDRYQTAGELAKDLQCVLDGVPIKLKPKLKMVPPNWRSLIPLVVLVSFTISIVLFWNGAQAPNRTTPAPIPAPSVPEETPPVILGQMYENGKGVPVDYAKAAHYYRIAMNQGSSDAAVALGLLYEDGKGFAKKDDKTAAKLYRKAADAGNTVGEHNIANMYDTGRGVPKDPKEAMKWYMKAAAKGYAWSQVNIGCLYERGRGVPVDLKKAFAWYMKAAVQHQPDGELNVGSCYQYGVGVKQNYQEANSWFSNALAHGHISAFDRIGNLYRFGHGVPRDYVQAVSFFKRGAEHDDRTSNIDLGFMYECGLGTARNYQEAFKCYNAAIKYDDPHAQLNLGILYKKGLGISRDDKIADFWFRKALASFRANTDNRDYDCCYDLGRMYENGYAVDKNMTEAIEWYKKAAALGFEEALERLKQLHVK